MAARTLFGTDGIRGKANTEPMSAETALRLGQAAGLMFVRGSHRHVVLIGKDTRLSGYMIEPALTAGFTSAGMDVMLIGPLPTPAVAMLTRSMRADLGVMISASHNPFEDNGIKLFGPDGFKLSDTTESEIETLMRSDLSARLAQPARLGPRLAPGRRRRPLHRERQGELSARVHPRGPQDRRRLRARRRLQGRAYRAVGARRRGGARRRHARRLHINRDVGSTEPRQLCEQVLAHGADLGIALDGDADRMLLADETGRLVDGDQILALIARAWSRSGRLTGGGVVATVMSNLGLERFLAAEGLRLHRTQVGDRYVAEQMRAGGMNVGGEQSGHMILSDFATTGDGLLAALQVLATVVAEGRPASEVCRLFAPLPQKLRNVRFSGPSPLTDSEVLAAVAEAERRLAGSGRLVLRPSGTEPLIRVMAEAEDEALVARIVDGLCETIAGVARGVAA